MIGRPQGPCQLERQRALAALACARTRTQNDTSCRRVTTTPLRLLHLGEGTLMKAFILPLALAALFTPGLGSADIYRYETDEGVVAFTDDVKRVPSRYQDSVKRITEASLFDYKRVTIVPRGARNTTAWTLPEDEVEAKSSEKPGRQVRINSNPATTTLDLPAQGEAPVMLERTTEWDWVAGRYVPFAVVKQDGKTVSITRLR